VITAPACFLVHRFEEGCYGGDGLCVRLKSDELRMIPVTFGFAAQNFLRQQCLAPERDQPFGIEIFWMQGPQSHPEM
jgi:hypothetical protein